MKKQNKKINSKKLNNSTNVAVYNTNYQGFIMQPKVDYCFKELMKDLDVLRGFLAAVLDIDVKEIKSVELLPTDLKKFTKDDKYGILDVRVNLNDDKYIDMEIQVLNFKYWRERSIYYLSKMFSEQLNEGDDYKELKKCIHIGILNFKLFKERDEYYSKFHLAEDKRHEIYSDKLEIHILELPKLKNATKIAEDNSENSLYDWCKFFNIENEEELRNMYGKNKYIDKACDKIIKLSADEQKKIEYDQRFKALCDYTTLMNSNYEDGVEAGMQRGIEQGIQQGKDSALLEMIKIKLEKGKSIELIAKELEKTEEVIMEYMKQL